MATKPKSESTTTRRAAAGKKPAAALSPPGANKLILDAALALFQERGFYGTSMRDLAARSGTAVSHLYYYYPSKASVLHSLMSSIVRDLIESLQAALAQCGPSATERLAALVHAEVIFHSRRQAEAFVGRSELRSVDQDARPELIALYDQVTALFMGAINDGIKSGEFSCPYKSEAGNAIITMCNSVSTWYRSDGALSPQVIARRYVHLALKMVGASPKK